MLNGQSFGLWIFVSWTDNVHKVQEIKIVVNISNKWNKLSGIYE